MGAITNLVGGLTTCHATPFHDVGFKIKFQNCEFQYVQYQGSASVLAVGGSPLGYRTSAPRTVTTDISLSNSGALMGMAMGTFTSAKVFGWALIQGSLADAGVTDLYISNEVIAPAKLARAAALAGRVTLAIAVDSSLGIERLAAALTAAGTQLDVFVEIDVGQGRCGVAPAAAGALAHQVVSHGLRFAGLQAYHGRAQHKKPPGLPDELLPRRLQHGRRAGPSGHRPARRLQRLCRGLGDWLQRRDRGAAALRATRSGGHWPRHEDVHHPPGFPQLAFGHSPVEKPGWVCWDRSFVGAVWFSDHDQTSGAVVCKPVDEVDELGKITYRAVTFWRFLRGLPIP